MQTALKADKTYIPALDGLRAISIAFVVIRHFEISTLVSANLGVTIFFFVSGFIITRLLLAEHRETGGVNIWSFYLRRFYRLIPANFLMISIVVLGAMALGQTIDWGQVAAGYLYVMNYFTIALRDAGGAYALPINPLWSLAVEEHFYLIFPALLIALAATPRRFATVLLGLLVAILAWRLVNIYALGFTPKYNYFATESRIGTILWGALLALIADMAGTGSKRAASFILSAANPFLFLICGTALLATLFLPGEELRHSVRYTLQGLLLIPIVSFTVFGTSFGFVRKILSLRPMIFLGRISYSLYLWHLPVYFFLPLLFGFESMPIAVAALAVSLAIASASFFLVERPILRFGRSSLATRPMVADQ